MPLYQTKTGTDIDEAIKHLERGDLVAIPTETVYGLAANAYSEKAVEKIFTVKRRPATNPLIVHVDRIAEVKAIVRDMPETAELLLEHFAPGPITLLLPKNALIPGIVNAGRVDVAIRIPSHPVTLELLRRLDFPLVAPSANLFGTISPTMPEHVLKNFDGQIPYILDGGACEVGIESTVVGFEKDGTPLIFRQGAITAEEIRRVTGKIGARGNQGGASPGLLPFHYSPTTPLLLTTGIEAALSRYEHKRVGLLSFSQLYPGLPRHHQFVLSPQRNLAEAARNLYRGLHYLDELQLDVLLAEQLPDTGLGRALNDRLQKASFQYMPGRTV